MAIRNVDTKLWEDTKIADTFTKDDKYFWLFLLTTRYGNLAGCFEMSLKQMQIDLSFESVNDIKKLLKRFEEIHKMIWYDYDTSELLILNWFEYNNNKSPHYMRRVTKDFYNIKSKKFKEYIGDYLGIGALDFEV